MDARSLKILTALALLAATLAPLSASAPDSAGIEFFERKIRPVLVDSCYDCHSTQASQSKGGLNLDTRDAVLKGGDSGPALVPGKPGESLLIRAVRYQDENLQMPPKKKRLSPEAVRDLEHWVQLGAPDPRTSQPNRPGAPAAAHQHWAYKPVQDPSPPRIGNERWVATPVDAFVLAKLESEGLAPSPRADRRALIRRVYYDLIGLPPSIADVERFERDPSSRAYENLVDHLLSSPLYGERWARHWLDVARYADTKGYVFEEERRYPYSYTYRDYVIRAFNEDLPIDRFLLEQIAADRLDLDDDKRPLAALGYLTLGRRFLNNAHDIIDDRIDVVTRGMMGLTVVCARCHDHKYDPVPTADYYSLYGIFASGHEPGEKPMLGAGSLSPDYPVYLAEYEKRTRERDEFRDKTNRDLRQKLRDDVPAYLMLAQTARSAEDRGKRDALAREQKLDSGVLQRWMDHLDRSRKETNRVFAAWLAYSDIPPDAFAQKAPEITRAVLAPPPASHPGLHPAIDDALRQTPPSTLKDVADLYGRLLGAVDKEWHALASQAGPAPTALPDPAREELRSVLYGESSPTALDDGALRRLYDVPAAQRSRALQRRVEELEATHPGAPPRAMAFLDNATPAQPRVFLRGNPNNPGPQVPRQFLELLAGPARQPWTNGSGRLELARAIASRDNPLTARVFVNRVWLHHFGAGLVRTPSDFGVRSDPPTHPELLDHLASRFMNEGWSLKKLHRWILLSNTYQQSSDPHPRALQKDPNNFLLSHANRTRLDMEAMRDTLLAASGRLNLKAGGHAVEILSTPFSPRRTVYAFIERQNLPGFFRTFDFASPDTTSPQRFQTIVPQQALFLMNSPFLAEQARGLIDRVAARTQDDPGRVHQLYRIAFQRSPAPDELELAFRFLARNTPRTTTPALEPPAWRYGYGSVDTNDPPTVRFNPLPHYTGSTWQGSDKLPDPRLSWAMLNAAGGHPGANPDLAVIRRFTAPRPMTLAVRGALEHESEKGDGVRARLISSRTGLLGEWTVHKGKTETVLDGIKLEFGDTLDFVVDCRESLDSDSFNWAPRLDASDENGRWNAKADFAGPQPAPPQPLDRWEQLAQVLLLSNELMFVD